MFKASLGYKVNWRPAPKTQSQTQNGSGMSNGERRTRGCSLKRLSSSLSLSYLASPYSPFFSLLISAYVSCPASLSCANPPRRALNSPPICVMQMKGPMAPPAWLTKGLGPPHTGLCKCDSCPRPSGLCK